MGFPGISSSRIILRTIECGRRVVSPTPRYIMFFPDTKLKNARKIAFSRFCSGDYSAEFGNKTMASPVVLLLRSQPRSFEGVDPIPVKSYCENSNWKHCPGLTV